VTCRGGGRGRRNDDARRTMRAPHPARGRAQSGRAAPCPLARPRRDRDARLRAARVLRPEARLAGADHGHGCAADHYLQPASKSAAEGLRSLCTSLVGFDLPGYLPRMFTLVRLLFGSLVTAPRSRAALVAEILGSGTNSSYWNGGGGPASIPGRTTRPRSAASLAPRGPLEPARGLLRQRLDLFSQPGRLPLHAGRANRAGGERRAAAGRAASIPAPAGAISLPAPGSRITPAAPCSRTGREAQGLPERVIKSVAVDGQGQIILGTHGHGVVRLEGTRVDRRDFYNHDRVHQAMGKDAPDHRPPEPPDLGKAVALPRLGGLHHRYCRRAV
jgi:hypothetical protein